MSNSPNLGLPLLQAAQAQKHVTVNEALALLDGLGHLILADTDETTPPLSPAEGTCYGVPTGAVNAWAGQVGRIALWSNGGWVFADPVTGWRAFVQATAALAVFDGVTWVHGAQALSANGAATIQDIVEIDHVVSAGASNAVTAALPAGSMVIGVTGRVTSVVTGALASWRIGVAGSDNRYGSGIGLAQDTWLSGLSSAPVTYYSDTDLILTGDGGDFAGGTIRLAVHLMRLRVPQ